MILILKKEEKGLAYVASDKIFNKENFNNQFETKIKISYSHLIFTLRLNLRKLFLKFLSWLGPIKNTTDGL